MTIQKINSRKETKMSTLYVENKIQKALFEGELVGQLSDGYWENSRPMNHWKPWVDCKVVVSDKVGRDFWADKDNYNFSAPMLLEAVGTRMLNRAKAVILGFSEKAIQQMPDDLQEYQWYYNHAQTSKDTYWAEKVEKMNAAGINEATMKAIEESNVYTMKMLRADLNGLKKAARTMVR